MKISPAGQKNSRPIQVVNFGTGGSARLGTLKPEIRPSIPTGATQRGGRGRTPATGTGNGWLSRSRGLRTLSLASDDSSPAPAQGEKDAALGQYIKIRDQLNGKLTTEARKRLTAQAKTLATAAGVPYPESKSKDFEMWEKEFHGSSEKQKRTWAGWHPDQTFADRMNHFLESIRLHRKNENTRHGDEANLLANYGLVHRDEYLSLKSQQYLQVRNKVRSAHFQDFLNYVGELNSGSGKKKSAEQELLLNKAYSAIDQSGLTVAPSAYSPGNPKYHDAIAKADAEIENASDDQLRHWGRTVDSERLKELGLMLGVLMEKEMTSRELTAPRALALLTQYGLIGAEEYRALRAKTLAFF